MSRPPARSWNDLSLRAKGVVVVAIPVVALLAGSGLFYAALRTQNTAAGLVTHTLEVRNQIEDVRTILVDGETGVRGYLLTGQDEFLEPYNRVDADLGPTLGRLRSLVSDNPRQRRRLGALDSLISKRVDLMRRLREYPATGGLTSQPVQELLRQGKQSMDAVRAELDVMRAEEVRLLAARSADERRLRTIVIAAIVAIALMGLAGGLVAVLLFTSGVVRRARHLEDNARRLEEGVPLLPLHDARDEIGRLGHALHQAGELLGVRQRSLQDAQAFLEHLIATAPGVIVRIDTAQNAVTYVSPNAERVLGYPERDIVGVHEFFSDHVHPDDMQTLRTHHVAVLTSKTPQPEYEFRLRQPGGRYRWFSSSIRPDLAEDGAVASILAYILDVTERKEAGEELARAKDEAERANLAKSEFLSRMSHELRTPLNAILGFAQLLEMDAETPDDKQSVGYIIRGGRHLLELINEVLDISRVESGTLSLSLEPVSAPEAVREALELVGPLAAQHGIELDDSRVTGTDHHVMADRQRLNQVLLNLLSNAVKYNRPGGGVAVSVERAAQGHLRIEVADTGPGIAQDKLDRVFMPFDRLGAEQGEVEGTGIGLALSRSLVELMGGEIAMTSELGRGTTFSLELPLAESPPERVEAMPPAAPSAAAAGPRRTVLCIEDNASSLRLLERILQHRPNVRLLTAIQGSIGLELARQHRPDLILLDLNLPDFHGREVLGRLRSDPATALIPVIVLSADATPGQIRRLLDAGARDYLTKPIDVVRCLEVLDEALEGGETEQWTHGS